MENRIKNLEIEISYLKRDIDSLKVLLLHKCGTVTNNNITYNMPIIPQNELEEDMFDNGFNFN